MENPIETLDYRGYKIEIYPDSDPRSPDEDGDDNLFLVHYHRQFWIEHKSVVSQDNVRDIYQGNESDTVEDLKKKYWIFPVKALIHSGVHLSLGHGGFGEDPGGWDTSHVGLMFVAKEEWPSEKKAEEIAEGHIGTWNQYLSGDIYGYIIKDANGREKDSCWGFYGKGEAVSEAKLMADYHVKSDAKQQSKMVSDVTRGARQLAKPIAVKSHLRDGRPVRQHRRRRP